MYLCMHVRTPTLQPIPRDATTVRMLNPWSIVILLLTLRTGTVASVVRPIYVNLDSYVPRAVLVRG